VTHSSFSQNWPESVPPGGEKDGHFVTSRSGGRGTSWRKQNGIRMQPVHS
jgi:hypothetical protein